METLYGAMCQYKIYTCVNIHGGNFGIIFAKDLVQVAKHGCSLVADLRKGIPLRRLCYRLCIAGHGGFTANHQGVFLFCCGSRRKGPFKTRVSRGSRSPLSVVTIEEGFYIAGHGAGGGRSLKCQEGRGVQTGVSIVGHREGLNLLDKKDRLRSLYIAGNTEEQRRIGRLHSSGLAGSRVGAHCYGSIQVAILRYNCN